MIKRLLLILPALFFVFMIVQAEINKNKGTIWTVPIAGYDPRDLLRGHFLQFQYVWNWSDQKDFCLGEECCLCVNKSGEDTKNPKVSSLTCEKANEANVCESKIKGIGIKHFDGTPQFYMGRGSNDLGRFYVPEEYAAQLNDMILNQNQKHEFEISLNVTEDGRAFINSMTVDAEDFWAWIRNQTD